MDEGFEMKCDILRGFNDIRGHFVFFLSFFLSKCD